MDDKARWLPREPRRSNSTPLFCLPNAGGGASMYRRWGTLAPDLVEVVPIQLPGREERLCEAPIDHLDELIDCLVDVLADYLDSPYALFGHSMGSAVAYRLAMVVAQSGGPEPLGLFVSSFRGPHLLEPLPAMSTMSEVHLLETMSHLGGTPAELLEDQEYMGLVLPTVRADLRVAASVARSVGPSLSCPITAFGGRDDPSVSAADLSAWQRHTVGQFRARSFSGGHFYLAQHASELLAEIGGQLQGASSAEGGVRWSV